LSFCLVSFNPTINKSNNPVASSTQQPSITWANEPPSLEEQLRVKAERSLMRAVIDNNLIEVKQILSETNNMKINFRTSGKTTVLHVAASTGNMEICEYLVSRGADVQATNSLGYTPLFAAVINGRKSVVKWLIGLSSEKDLKKTSKKGLNLKDAAKMYGHDDLAIEIF
jgi:ankyrin repeat protein